ncbi:hypothetical protein FRB93_002805 [Tulasnella sp. JGI-2019a]|nr:hypothetical protein FRB93_002805 [Tulasnella sp. JGI-2019a]
MLVLDLANTWSEGPAKVTGPPKNPSLPRDSADGRFTTPILQVLFTVVKAVPIPEPFKSAVVGIPDAVLQIITIVETAKGNMEDAKVLALYIATLTDRTIRSLDLSHMTLPHSAGFMSFIVHSGK